MHGATGRGRGKTGQVGQSNERFTADTAKRLASRTKQSAVTRPAQGAIGADLDRIAGAWVASLPRGSLANIERAKANEGDDVALLQRISDRIHRRVQRASGRRFGDVSMLGDRVDQF